jgi:hypothetical protein
MKILVSFLMVLSFLLVGCSNQKKSSAKLKINLGNLLNMPAGIGDGGAILFGQSSAGEIFGKAITASELDLTLNNGQWKFWAFFWDNANVASLLNGNVLCGKTTANLNGGNASLSISVTNAACNDPEISSIPTYNLIVPGTSGTTANTATTLVKFPQIMMEDCDNLTKNVGGTCGILNQGGVMSYKLIFQEYEQTGAGPISFSGNQISTACQSMSYSDPIGGFRAAHNINFPAGSPNAIFAIKARYYFGSTTCDDTDKKGNYEIVFDHGLSASSNPSTDQVLSSTQTCSAVNSTYFPSSFSTYENQAILLCRNEFSFNNSGMCNSAALNSSFRPSIQNNFLNMNGVNSAGVQVPKCNTQSASGISIIKHLIEVPSNVYCPKYKGQSTIIGNHPFAAGEGSDYRPYKICTEWQLNQISEFGANTTNLTKYYALMNDLDMNNIERGMYTAPYCNNKTTPNFEFKNHNNFNPIGLFPSLGTVDCDTVLSPAGITANQFSGGFNGNGHKISNIRSTIKGMYYNGFIRYYSSSGTGGFVRDLTLVNPEFEGKTLVGAFFGFNSFTTALIENLNVFKGKISASSSTNSGKFVGAIAGNLAKASGSGVVRNIAAERVSVSGDDFVGGLIGYLAAQTKVDQAHFKGQITTNNSGGLYVGGLIGQTAGSVNTSYSEGLIQSSAQNIGGLFGFSYGGSATDVYSTMYILPTSTLANNYLGGLVGSQTNGTITNAVFDGAISQKNGALGIANDFGIQSNVVCSNVFVNDSSDFSTANCTGTSVKTNSALRSLNSTNFSSPVLWQFQTNEIPRLSNENRECILNILNGDTVVNQVNAGRGSAVNPVVICNSNQLIGLNNRPTSEYYRMAQDINLINLKSFDLMIPQFNGNFNGDFNSFFGMQAINLNDSALHNYGLFRTNSGTISNLKFYGNYFQVTDTSDIGTGIVAGINTGSLLNIELLDNMIVGKTNDGGLTGKNTTTGIINSIFIDSQRVGGEQNFGGITGQNDGVVTKVSVKADIYDQASNHVYSTSNMGGAIGLNNNFVDQIKFNGTITNSIITASSLNAGGIIGDNEGTLTNSYTDNYATLDTVSSTNIGGLVGLAGANSHLTNSFSLMRMVYKNTTGTALSNGMPFGPIIGNINNGYTIMNSYYLDNFIGSNINGATTYSVSDITGGLPSYTVSLNFDNLSSPQPGFYYTNINNGNSLKTFVTSYFITSNSFNESDQAYTIGENIYFIEPYTSPLIVVSGANKTIATIGSIDTFCSGGSWAGTAGSEKCTNGFDIIYEDSSNSINNKGVDRMLNYNLAKMNNAPIPVDAPIWQFGAGDSYPKLLQVDN